MAATQTITFTGNVPGTGICAYQWDWISHTDGTVSGLAASATITGTIVGVLTNPGSTAPTDNYDITLTDSNGFDVLAGQGADRDTANTEMFCPGIPFKDGVTTSIAPVVVNSPLTLGVTNAGSGKVGTLILFVRN